MKLSTLGVLLSTVLMAGGMTACGPRQVEVTTGPQAVSEVTLAVTNNLDEAVNVYVVNGDTEIFLKQVAGNTTERLSVPGVPAGSVVKLRATPATGSTSYTRDNVTLSGLYEWQVP